MKRIIFRLSMPRNNAWDRKWSGEGRDYSIDKRLKDSDWDELKANPRWIYSFGDGWLAAVTAAEAAPREKASGKFCGYDWMVNSILKNGVIQS